MLYVLITFDYELFFGKNYDSSRVVLFDPAKRIVDILEEENVKSTFFADVCSVIRHQELGLDDYVKDFSEQMCHFYGLGHDVQLHVHPHWLTSKYVNGEWVFAKEMYSLGECGYDVRKPFNSYEVIDSSLKCLESILTPHYPSYKCVSYRAGGYSIEPYNKLFPYLKSKGIIIDSSVAMFTKSAPGIPQKYDYTSLPHLLNWWIGSDMPIDDITSSATTPGAVYELPIAYYKKRITDRLFLGKKNMTFSRGKSTGTGIATGMIKSQKKSVLKKILEYNKSYQKLSLDTMGAKVMSLALKRIYEKYDAGNKDAYVAVIGHPKSFGGDAFENMREFINDITREPDKYRFITVADLCDKLIVDMEDK